MKFNFAKTVCAMLIAVALWRGVTLSAASILILPTAPAVVPLPERMWQEFVIRTNAFPGRVLYDAADSEHPTWKTNSLIYGLGGWNGIGYNYGTNAFTVPVTALSRRHIYWRGHSAGVNGWGNVGAAYPNRLAQFLTPDNRLLKFHIIANITRFGGYNGAATYTNNGIAISTNIFGDYSVGILETDLPPEIQPVAVVTYAQQALFSASLNPPWFGMHAPWELGTEQGVSVGVLGIDPLYKGGDSGSPNMFIYGGQLYFSDGRTTSGWTQNMQNDMDALSTVAGLNPADYQPTFFAP